MKNEANIAKLRVAAKEVVKQYELLHDTFASISSITQWHAILEIHDHEKINMKKLGEHLNICKSAVSRHIRQLITKEICEIEIDTYDRRNKFITLTKKGLNFFNKTLYEIRKEIYHAVDTMSDQDFEIALKGLSVYAEALKNARAKRNKST